MLEVLVPLDGSEIAERAVPHAVAILKPFSARIVLLRVITPAEFRTQEAFRRVDWRLEKRHAQSYLDGVADRVKQSGVECEVRVEEGQPAQVILEIARELGSQLLVLSSHGRGLAFDFQRGGDASKTLSAFGASVLLVDGRPAAGEIGEVRYQNIFVPVDGSHRSEIALRIATGLAQSLAARLTVAGIAEQPKPPSIICHDARAISLCHQLADLTREAANRQLAQIKARIPQEIALHTTVLLARSPVDAIAEGLQQIDADLIVSANDILSSETATMDCRVAALNLPMLLLNADHLGAAFQKRHPDDDLGVTGADIR